MGLLHNFVDHMTKKSLQTVLHPFTSIDNEITLTTSKKYNHHAYIIPISNIKFTDKKSFITSLPKKSNIKDALPLLDKIKKEIKGDKLSSYGDDYSTMAYVDRVNRYFATKVETPKYLSIAMRGDIANLLFLKGYFLVQCDNSSCDVSIPSKLKVDFPNFVARDPSRKKKDISALSSKGRRDFSRIGARLSSIKNYCEC